MRVRVQYYCACMYSYAHHYIISVFILVINFKLDLEWLNTDPQFYMSVTLQEGAGID
jgi:hypothetical protein